MVHAVHVRQEDAEVVYWGAVPFLAGLHYDQVSRMARSDIYTCRPCQHHGVNIVLTFANLCRWTEMGLPRADSCRGRCHLCRMEQRQLRQ